MGTNKDIAGNVAYAAAFQYSVALRIAVCVLFTLLAASVSTNVMQWRRPPTVLVVRVDEAGRAEAIRYRNTDYTPREAEIVSGLNTWAIDRFRLMKSVIDTNFKSNYYFLDSRLARELTVNDAEVVANVQAGKALEQDVQINGIRFRAFETRKDLDGTVGTGECVIDMYKSYSVASQAR